MHDNNNIGECDFCVVRTLLLSSVSKPGKSDGDVEVVLEVHRLHSVEGNVCENHKIFAQSVDAIHCCQWLRHIVAIAGGKESTPPLY